MSSLMSTPSTRPVEPTSAAISTANCPAPHPTSRIRSPGCTASASSSCFRRAIRSGLSSAERKSRPCSSLNLSRSVIGIRNHASDRVRRRRPYDSIAIGRCHTGRCHTNLYRCAWQESNLLPFGPEPNALSGELQARERFSLECGLRGSISSLHRPNRIRGRVPEHRALASSLNDEWQSLRTMGAISAAISLYTSDSSACTAELAAVAKPKSPAAFVAMFRDEGQADRAWQSGVLGFVPPAPGELPPGLNRGTATGLGLSSWTYP